MSLKVNLIFSAYVQLNGVFDFNHTPMDLPVTNTLVHENPHNRFTWAPHIH